jgi:hypothetical protein
MRSTAVDVAIIGAGPYGLSLAAHLCVGKLSYRIFGTPMSSWRNHMLTRTWLKSDGFASSSYDPDSASTLAQYCQEQSLPYADVGLPVPIETFVAYGLEFQKRFVAQLEETEVTGVTRIPGGFELATQTGEIADTHLIARRATIAFHQRSSEPRPIAQRLLVPRSGLGLGWRSRICNDAPLLFRSMPSRLRRRAVQRHLGPAFGWFAKSRFVGRVTSHLGTHMRQVDMHRNRVSLKFTQQDGSDTELQFDHVICATGYKMTLQRLCFIDAAPRKRMATADDVPILNRNFQSVVPGLYFVGLAWSNSFGQLCRFAYGAKFTSKRLARHLANGG